MEDDDLHADLMAAYQQHVSDTGADNEPAAEEGKAPPDTSADQPPEGEGRNRDATGRFAPKVPAKDTTVQDGQPGEKTEQVADEQQPAQVQQPAQQTPPAKADKAPASWTPAEREHWKDVKPEVKAAILRRDAEVNAALQSSAESRQFQRAFTEVLRPFEPMVASEGGNMLAATRQLYQTAAFLRNGPPADKAKMVADMIYQFGIDINMLDQALSAGPQQRQQTQQQVYTPQQIDTLVDQRINKIGEQRTQAEVSKQLDDFINDPANEFVHDVGPLMASILQSEAQAGRVISLQDAYKRATLAHPEVSQILANRQGTSQTPAQLSAAARRAKNAAASVSDTGAPTRSNSPEQDDGSIRSALNASIQELSRSTRV